MRFIDRSGILLAAFAVWICLGSQGHCEGVGPVNLAIVADEAAGPLGNLLTERLGGLQGVSLVERERIDAILAEQTLGAAGFSGNDRTALGRWLGADGLVLLERIPGNGANALSARLVAVGPGVVTDAMEFDAGGDLAGVASRVSDRILTALPKFSVNKGDAVPVSVVRIRATASSPEALRVEAQLTSLLAARLAREPSIFVMERARMQDLRWEKEWEGKGDDFWNGRYVIDGRFETEGDRVRVLLRRTGPDGGVTEVDGIEGSAVDIPGLVDAIALETCRGLGLAGDSSDWSAAHEAAVFLDEAQWAYDLRLLDFAQSAAEASRALGCRDPALARLMVKIYAELAFPTRDRLKTPGVSTGYERDTIDPGESDRNLRFAQTAIAEQLTAFDPEDHQPNVAYHDDVRVQSAKAVLAASRVLRNYYEKGIDHSDLPALRANIRSLRKKVRELPWPLKANEMQFWLSLEATYAPFWFERPEEALPAYRELLEADLESGIRSHVVDALSGRHRDTPSSYSGTRDEVSTPFLVAWDPADAAEISRLWSDFMAGLSSDPDPVLQMDGRLLALSLGKQDTRDALLAGFLAALWKHREIVVERRLASLYFRAANAFGHRMDGGTVDFLEYFLRHAPDTRGHPLHYIWKPDRFSDAEARRLYPAWKEYVRRTWETAPEMDRAELFGRYEASLAEAHPELRDPVEDAVKVREFWASYPLPNGQDSYDFVVRSLQFHGNRLYIAGRAQMARPVRMQLFEVDLESRQTREIYSREGEPYTLEFVAGDAGVYVYDGVALRGRADDGEWRSFPAPWEPRYVRMCEAAGKIYVGFGAHAKQSDCGLYEFDPVSGTFALIAGNRRRPALNELDSRDGYSVFDLYAGPDGGLWVNVDFEILRYDRGNGQWDRPFGNVKPVSAVASSAATLFHTPWWDWVTIPNGGGAPVPLMANRIRLSGRGEFESASLPGLDATAPTWLLPADWEERILDFYQRPLALDEAGVWALTPTSDSGLFELDRYLFGAEKPITVALDFQLSEPARGSKREALNIPDQTWTQGILRTPQGLVVQSIQQPCLWFIPEKDLERIEASAGRK